MNEILLAMQFKSVMKRIYKKYDYNEYGGAPLLGVNGTAFICHGASESEDDKERDFDGQETLRYKNKRQNCRNIFQILQ